MMGFLETIAILATVGLSVGAGVAIGHDVLADWLEERRVRRDERRLRRVAEREAARNRVTRR